MKKKEEEEKEEEKLYSDQSFKTLRQVCIYVREFICVHKGRTFSPAAIIYQQAKDCEEKEFSPGLFG